MATEATAARSAGFRAVRHRRLLAFGRGLLNQSLNLYAALALIYLLVPIAVIILFSFNDPQSRFNFAWHGFTLDYWKDPFGVPGLTDALVKSIEIAALSTIGATILGTMMALALVRYEFRGRGRPTCSSSSRSRHPRSSWAPRCCRSSSRSVSRRASPRS
jgi:ABC-type glycerol-3-phosphate transport system permease component